MTLRQVITRVVETITIGGSGNYLGRPVFAIVTSQIVKLLGGSVTAGVQTAQSPIGYVSPTHTMAAVITPNGVTGPSTAATNEAINTKTVATDTLAGGVQIPGGKITQTTFSLTRTMWVSTAAGYAVNGRTDWTNPTNVQGVNDGAVAAFAGNALGARSGGVVAIWIVPTNKTALTITAVTLRFYIGQGGTLLNNGSLVYGYQDAAAVRTTLATVGGDQAVGTFIDYDVTSVVAGNWANVAAGKISAVWATASTGLLNGTTCSWDACALIVTATLTQPQ